MLPDLRRRFNDAFQEADYGRFRSMLETRCGVPVTFRCSETPVFLERNLLATMADVGRELAERILADSACRAEARQAIPPAFRVPDEAARPLFVQADFGLDETHAPQLVEIQGFPSLYAFQPLLAQTYRDAYGLPETLTTYLGGLDAAGYGRLVRNAILGAHDPAEVALLELFPERQKTLPDFRLTERLCGLRTVCATQVRRAGRRLFFPDGAPIRRIYNRVIAEDVGRSGAHLPFSFADDLQVEWAGHPNWYFLLSKLALPRLTHPNVPPAWRLSGLPALPRDLENYVLKPLFSFAGQGVVVGPTREQVEAVDDPAGWLLQRRVHFVPTIETPHGPTRIEVRIMYVDTAAGLTPATTLIRMGRGAQMGVDFNRNLAWVGASAAFAPGDG